MTYSSHLLAKFAAPAPGLGSPLEMFDSYHLQVKQRCRTLAKLPAYLQQHGNNGKATQLAGSLVNYFTYATSLHHADEEEDLFPMVKNACKDSSVLKFDDTIRRLKHQHVELDKIWDSLAVQLDTIASGKQGTINETQAQAFLNAYTYHISTEDSEILSFARLTFTTAELTELSNALSTRRRSPFACNPRLPTGMN